MKDPINSSLVCGQHWSQGREIFLCAGVGRRFMKLRGADLPGWKDEPIIELYCITTCNQNLNAFAHKMWKIALKGFPGQF